MLHSGRLRPTRQLDERCRLVLHALLEAAGAHGGLDASDNGQRCDLPLGRLFHLLACPREECGHVGAVGHRHGPIREHAALVDGDVTERLGEGVAALRHKLRQAALAGWDNLVDQLGGERRLGVDHAASGHERDGHICADDARKKLSATCAGQYTQMHLR